MAVTRRARAMAAAIQSNVNGTSIASELVRAITTHPTGMNATSQISTCRCIRRICVNATRCAGVGGSHRG
jgi:hypothetical protein